MANWQLISGLVQYQDGLAIMEKQLEKVIAGEEKDTIYLLEHDHVYTAGTSAKDNELKAKLPNVPIIHVGRGGKYTYHGPGQRVIYPILDLRKEHREQDLKLYIKQLEHWIISTLSRFGIECYIIPDKVGIWTNLPQSQGPAKIGAIGIRVRKWVTYHGIAVNISNDLNMYKGIIPCGISDFPVTSIYSLGREVTMDMFDKLLKEEYTKIFE